MILLVVEKKVKYQAQLIGAQVVAMKIYDNTSKHFNME